MRHRAPLRVSADKGEIPLTRGKVALIDPEDHERIARHNWYANKSGESWYAQRTLYDGPLKGELMHRVIMNAPPDMDVDHINGNGLDNRKCNLRLATPSQNQQNRHSLSLNKSGYRGVTFNKICQKWQAQIKKDGRSHHLGLHETVVAAAMAYDEGAMRLFGKFARLNFPNKAQN